jgi:hypothetical protein
MLRNYPGTHVQVDECQILERLSQWILDWRYGAVNNRTDPGDWASEDEPLLASSADELLNQLDADEQLELAKRALDRALAKRRGQMPPSLDQRNN